MTSSSTTFRPALDEVSASSSGGAPFLIAYSFTFLVAGVLAFFLERPPAAVVAMFQGAVALPLAFWLEARMRTRPMAADNPLRALSGLLAVSQALGLPALIVAYSLNPGSVPVVLASLGGMHFLPYAWLQRTRVYVGLGVAVAVGAFGLQIVLGSAAFAPILLYIAAVYAVAAPLVYRHAARLVRSAENPTESPGMADGEQT